MCRSNVSLQRFKRAREHKSVPTGGGLCFLRLFSDCELTCLGLSVHHSDQTPTLLVERNFAPRVLDKFWCFFPCALFLSCPKAYMWSHSVSYSVFYGWPKAYVWTYRVTALAYSRKSAVEKDIDAPSVLKNLYAVTLWFVKYWIRVLYTWCDVTGQWLRHDSIL
jgi:hypothetical protein